MRKLGAVILTGGASSRMGEDKAAARWLGKRAVDRVADLAAQSGATAIVTVGRVDHGLCFVADSTPFGGPVGGIMVGAATLRRRGCDLALVLAVDAPTIRADDVQPLLAESALGAAYEGSPLPLLVNLKDLSLEAPPDWPIHRLIEFWGLSHLAVPPGAGPRLRGANTPAEREALARELAIFESAPS